MKKMKKFFAILVAAIMVMSMSFAAFADVVTTTEPILADSETTFYFNKVYVTTATKNNETPTDSATFPKETLVFTVEAAESNPADGEVIPKGETTGFRVEDQTISKNPEQIAITIPAYTKVGVYDYTIKEQQGNTQGVDYDISNNIFNVQVLVTWNDNYTALEKQVTFSTKENDSKVDTIKNMYDLGTLTVEKVVSGKLGDQSKYFTINVVLTSKKVVLSDITYSDNVQTTDEDGNTVWIAEDKVLEAYDADSTSNNEKWTANENGYTAELSIKIKHGGKVTFSNIPAGVTYEIAESNVHTTGDLNGAEGYTVSYENKEGSIYADGTAAAKVTNTKDTGINTGIILDSAPYILLLALAGLGMFAVVSKKREDEI